MSRNAHGQSSNSVIGRLSHIMAQVAVKQPWPMLIQHISTHSIESCHSTIAALRLMEILSDYCAEDISSNADTLRQFFSRCFTMSETNFENEATFLTFRATCARSAAACIVSIEDDDIRDSFKPAVPYIMTVLGSILSAHAASYESYANGIMEHLCTIGNLIFSYNKSKDLINITLNNES